MPSRDRRAFLKKSAAAVTAMGLPACAAGPDADSAGGQRTDAGSAVPRTLDPDLLRALADVVLPGELGAPGREAAVAAFESWLAGFTPVAERPHPYLAPRLTYGPSDPAPGWAAQLQGLELESRQRYGKGFAEIEASPRESMVRGQVDGSQGLPEVARARHVAVGLMSHFFGSSVAGDLCHGAQIGKETCRGLGGLEGAPTAS